MRTGAKIGTALVGGYLLGRASKAKPPAGLGTLLAAKKPDVDLRGLAATAAQAKDNAAHALHRNANLLADGLQERTRRLRNREERGETPGDEDDGAGERAWARDADGGAYAEDREPGTDVEDDEDEEVLAETDVPDQAEETTRTGSAGKEG